MYPRGEKWAQDRKLLALIRLPLKRMNFPLESKKSILFQGAERVEEEEPVISMRRNGQRVGGDAEKRGVTETSRREF